MSGKSGENSRGCRDKGVVERQISNGHREVALMQKMHARTVPFGRRINGPELGVGNLPLY